MKKDNKNISFEQVLWNACDALRGSVEPAEYKHVVLSLIFLKFVSDKFEERRKELIDDGKEKFIEIPEFYLEKNVFYLPKTSRWNYILENAKQPDIALKIDTALSDIEKSNKSLKGALPDNYYSRLDLDVSSLSSLLDEINKIDTLKDKENDIIGRVYEFFLKEFALLEGKGKGEFYTPKSIVNLISELIQPYKGKVYDPCCGSGGMFVQSVKFIESHNGNKRDISIYGQEKISTTYKLAKMNLAIRGISSDLGESAANTFLNDLHKDLKADYIMANPPFNQSKWRSESQLLDDPRWSGYDVPSTGNANYAWILHIVSKLSNNGIAGFLLANGSLTSDYNIRKQLIKNDLVEAIILLPRKLFYTTDIGVCLWIINKNKKTSTKEINNKFVDLRNRENEILFINLRSWGIPFEKKYIEFSEEEINNVSNIYHSWQTGVGYNDIKELCKSVNIHEIEQKKYTLNPLEYIEYDKTNEKIVNNEEIIKNIDEINKLLMKKSSMTNDFNNILRSLKDELQSK